jgi:hypothetical protein
MPQQPIAASESSENTKKLMDKLYLNEAKEKVSAALDEIAGSRTVTTAGETIRKAANQGLALANEGYEKTGAKKAVKRASGKFDEVSGKAILEEVRKFIEVQSYYNDVLATKLQEALDRLSVLEERVNKS